MRFFGRETSNRQNSKNKEENNFQPHKLFKCANLKVHIATRGLLFYISKVMFVRVCFLQWNFCFIFGNFPKKIFINKLKSFPTINNKKILEMF